MSVSVAGGSGTTSYKWQSSPNGIDTWTDIPLATSASYNASSLAIGHYYYQCVVTNTCKTITSSGAHIQAVIDPSVTNPVGATICSGSTHAMSVTGSGGTPSLIYIWESSPDGVNGWGMVALGASNSYTTPALTQTTYYRVWAFSTGSGCGWAISNNAAVLVPSISVQPVSNSICSGGSASISVTTISEGAGLTCQWKYYNGLSWNNVTDNTPIGATYSNATTANLTIAGISGTGSYPYRCQVIATLPSATVCSALISNPATITVNSDILITSQPAETTICSGETQILHVTATGGAPLLNYQWQYWNGSAFNNVTGGSGAQTANYTTPALTQDTHYQVLVSSTGLGCDLVSSNETTAVVNNVTGGTITADQTICEGGDPAAFATSVAVTGDATPTYEWFSSTNNSTCTTTGVTTENLDPGVLTQDTWYKRVATSVFSGKTCTANSNTVKVTVNNFTSGNTLNAQTICDGSTATVTGNTITADGTLTYT